MTTTQGYAEYRDENEVTAFDAQGRYARIERDVETGGMPTYIVLLGVEFAGTILDEQLADGTSLPRGRFAAWSGRKGSLGFFDTIETAADVIAETWPAPSGPKGTELPQAQWKASHVRTMDPMQRYNLIAEAARLHSEDGLTVAKAWQAAIDADWKRLLAATPVRDEDEYENCLSVLGGKVHTATPDDDPKMHTLPLCRTGGQNHMRTRYATTKLNITCTTCIEQREYRATRRAAQRH